LSSFISVIPRVVGQILAVQWYRALQQQAADGTRMRRPSPRRQTVYTTHRAGQSSNRACTVSPGDADDYEIFWPVRTTGLIANIFISSHGSYHADESMKFPDRACREP